MSEQPERKARAGRYGGLERILDLTEAGLWIALLIVGSVVALAVLREGSPRDRPRLPRAIAPSGLVEAEDLPVVAQSRDFTFWLQPTSDFPGGGWSKEGHMFAFRTVKGDWIELQLPGAEAGSYGLELFLTKAADYGIVTVSLNGIPIGEFDLWSDRGVMASGALDLGEVELGGQEDVLRLAIEGSNPSSSPPHFQFGIDGLRLRKREPAESAQAAERSVSEVPDTETRSSEDQ